MKIFDFLKQIGRNYRRNRNFRRIFLFLFLIWGFWTFGLGLLGGWFLTKSGLDKFPEIGNRERILILAPHIDDETIGGGGIILKALAQKASVKIVYLTNGDDSLGGVIKEDRKITLDPEQFVLLGEQRMAEGKRAMATLGLKENNLIFLGYPDQGLKSMLSKFYSETNPLVSPGTKFNHNPYRGTYRPARVYAGENLVVDLKEIITEFKPTTILVAHPRDLHPDHQATYSFLKKVLEEISLSVKIFSYLVHYPLYPPEKKLQKDSFLYPPKKLFSQKGWFSFELSAEEEDRKLQAMNQYQSQITPFYDFLRAFIKRNEIFEEME